MFFVRFVLLLLDSETLRNGNFLLIPKSKKQNKVGVFFYDVEELRMKMYYILSATDNITSRNVSKNYQIFVLVALGLWTVPV